MPAKISIALVHPGNISFDYHKSFLHTAQDRRFLIKQIDGRSGVNISSIRNTLHWKFLEGDDDYLLWTDSDISWVPDDVQTLIDTDVPIVSGLYYNVNERGELFPVVTLSGIGKDHRPTLEWTNEILDQGGITQVEGVGMGFCLLKREVVEKVGVRNHLWPFQETERTVKGQTDYYGEDVTFCLRAKAAGFPIYINLLARVGHKKEIHL